MQMSGEMLCRVPLVQLIQENAEQFNNLVFLKGD